MKKIAYTRPDGGVSICTPVISADDPPGFTEADALARAQAKDIPTDATNVTVLDEVPEDRTSRDDWTISDGAISVDTASPP